MWVGGEGVVVGEGGGRVGTYVSRLMGWRGGRVRGIAWAEVCGAKAGSCGSDIAGIYPDSAHPYLCAAVLPRRLGDVGEGSGPSVRCEE